MTTTAKLFRNGRSQERPSHARLQSEGARLHEAAMHLVVGRSAGRQLIRDLLLAVGRTRRQAGIVVPANMGRGSQ
jgi:hypothetical protein